LPPTTRHFREYATQSSPQRGSRGSRSVGKQVKIRPLHRSRRCSPCEDETRSHRSRNKIVTATKAAPATMAIDMLTGLVIASLAPEFHLVENPARKTRNRHTIASTPGWLPTPCTPPVEVVSASRYSLRPCRFRGNGISSTHCVRLATTKYAQHPPHTPAKRFSPRNRRARSYYTLPGNQLVGGVRADRGGRSVELF